MNDEMMLEISKVVADQQTPEQAVQALKTKYEKLLAGKLPVTYQ